MRVVNGAVEAHSVLHVHVRPGSLAGNLLVWKRFSMRIAVDDVLDIYVGR